MGKKQKFLNKIKPRVSVYICYTLICLGPLANLILHLINNDYKRLPLLITLTILTTPIIVYIWYEYKKQISFYLEIKEELLKNNP